MKPYLCSKPISKLTPLKKATLQQTKPKVDDFTVVFFCEKKPHQLMLWGKLKLDCRKSVYTCTGPGYHKSDIISVTTIEPVQEVRIRLSDKYWMQKVHTRAICFDFSVHILTLDCLTIITIIHHKKTMTLLFWSQYNIMYTNVKKYITILTMRCALPWKEEVQNEMMKRWEEIILWLFLFQTSYTRVWIIVSRFSNPLIMWLFLRQYRFVEDI